MSASTIPTKVLVTGASGYLGTHIVVALLSRGFSVRGTVRSAAKGEFVKDLVKNNKFEYVVVPNIEVAGAFDEVVKEVDGVIHAASPVRHALQDPRAAVGTAVEGTVGILESARKYGPNIKRIVITSSNSAVEDTTEGQKNFTESDWNDPAAKRFEELGKDVDGYTAYMASKTLAERAAWKYMKSNKDLHFTITTVCPPWILGPILTKLESPADINTSNQFTIFAGLKPNPTKEESIAPQGSWIDVRDISKIHIDLLSIEEAANERFIASAGRFTLQDVYDALNEDPAIPGCPVGFPGATKGKIHDLNLDSSKLQTVFGVPKSTTYRPLSETVRDVVTQFKEKGFF